MNESNKNLGCKLDFEALNNVNVNLTAVNNLAKKLSLSEDLTEETRAAWILKAITLIDLTTLAGDDTPSNVTNLCFKATRPIAEDLLTKFGFNYDDENCPIRTAAVCVYSARVKDAVDALKKYKFYDKINVASVATGFPAGQTPLKARLIEIEYAVENGATEIDIVINRTLVITGKWEELYNEIQQMKAVCGKAHLKSILATGELGTLGNVYKASLVAMMAGSDFIKTSTGKESVNATLPVGIVMARAIREFYERTGYKVGLKPAGGVRNTADALNWLILVKKLLGDDWLHPELFRFGASGLLNDLEKSLKKFIATRVVDEPSH